MSVLDTYAPFLSLSSDRLLALCIYGEASSEGAEGMMAVANVVANRVKNPTYGGNWFSSEIYNYTNDVWKAVILAPSQFSAFNPSDPVRQKLLSLAQDFDNIAQNNQNLFQAWQIAQMAVSGTLADNTGGATNYFNPYMVQPSWAAAMDFLGQLGNHVFYTVYPEAERTRDSVIGTATVIVKSPVTWIFITGIIGLGILTMMKRRA